MKTWTIAIVLSAVLITSGVADACHRGAKSASTASAAGMHGKITGVSGTSFTMTVGHRNHSRSMVVNITPGTSVTGITAFNSSIIGEFATVEGPATGDVINATSITISAAHHRKSAA